MMIALTRHLARAVALGAVLSASSQGYAAEAPADLIGTWTSEQGSCRASSMSYMFAVDALVIAGHRCQYAGARQLHASRWYLDAVCPDGTLVQLDINRLSADRLMIASRPLGEAEFYLRCKD